MYSCEQQYEPFWQSFRCAVCVFVPLLKVPTSISVTAQNHSGDSLATCTLPVGHVLLTYSGDSIAADCCTAWRKSRGLQEELIAQRSLAGVVARALSRAAARSSRAFAATLAILVKPPAGFGGHSEPLVGSAGSAAHSDSRSLLPSVVVSISCCFRAQDIVRMEAVVDVGDSIGIHDPASCS